MADRHSQRSTPPAPGWFRVPEDDMEFEAVELLPDDPSDSGVHISRAWVATRGDRPVEVDRPAVTATEPPAANPNSHSVRLRDVLVGAAAATLLFGTFSIGFLSRGLISALNDHRVQASYERAADSSLVPVAAAPSPEDAIAAVPVVVAEAARPSREEPSVAVAEVVAEAVAVPVTSPVPQLKLDDSLTQTILARPTSRSFKIGSRDTASLNLAIGSSGNETRVNSEPGQCSQAPLGPIEGEHGTKIAWADSPDEARQLARDQNKLVFTMHVSGNFEKPGFT